MPRRLRVKFPGIYTLAANPAAYALTGGSAVLTANQTSQTVDPNADYLARSTSPGVFRAFHFDDTSQLGINIRAYSDWPTVNAWGFAYANNNTVGVNPPVIDTAVYSSGTGALRFTIPSQSGSDCGGAWGCRFYDDATRGFGLQSSFFIQVRVRVDTNWMTTAFYDSTGAGISGMKLMLTSSNTTMQTRSDMEITTQTYSNQRFLQMYKYPSDGLYSVLSGGTDFGLQDAQPACLYSASGTTFTHTGCVHLAADEWITLQMGVDVTDMVTTDEFGSAYNDGYHWKARVRLWQTRPGQQTQLLIDYDPATTPGYTPFHSGSSTDGQQLYGGFYLLPYITGKDPNQVHPDCHMWMDELIMSTQRIPDPGTTSTRPTWASSLTQYALTNITADGSTAQTAYSPYTTIGGRNEGNGGQPTQNLLAWGSACLAPTLGSAGSMLFGADGHEAAPAATIHRFDLATAKWTTPAGPPQIHLRVSSLGYPAPPTGAEVWYDPDNVDGYQNAATFSYTSNGSYGSAGQTYTDVTAVLYRYLETGVGFPTGLWSSGYVYKPWPPVYGFEYNTNVSSRIRYDSMVVVPPQSSSDEATLYSVGQNVPHIFDGTSGLSAVRYGGTYPGGSLPSTGTSFVNGLGLSSGAWTKRSTNEVAATVGHGVGVVTAYSEKQHKVFCFNVSLGGTANVGTYDPVTNACTTLNSQNGYGFTSNGSADGGNGIVTNGFEYDLFITNGFSTPGNITGLMVWDTDEALAATPSALNYAWMLMNAGSADVRAYPDQRAGVLNIAWVSTSPSGAVRYGVAWSKARQKLILIQTPLAAADYGQQFGVAPPNLSPWGVSGGFRAGGYSAPMTTFGAYSGTAFGNYLIHILTIPTGTTNGIPNWRTQPWGVTRPTITLASGVTGLHLGNTGGNFKRISYSDECDCLILACNPCEMPVQALRLF